MVGPHTTPPPSGGRKVSAYLIGTGTKAMKCDKCGAPVVATAGVLADVSQAKLVINREGLVVIIAADHAMVCGGVIAAAQKMPPLPPGLRNRGRNGSS